MGFAVGWEVEVRLRSFISVTLLTEFFEVSYVGGYMKCEILSEPHPVLIHYKIEAHCWHVSKRVLLIDIGFTWR